MYMLKRWFLAYGVSREVQVSREAVCESCGVLQFCWIVYYGRVKGYSCMDGHTDKSEKNTL